MGFRSTFTTLDFPIEWPDWFREKYASNIHFPVDGTGTLSSKREAKTYWTLSELHTDIQRAIVWDEFMPKNFVLVYLHECGGITRCQIGRDRIVWSEPSGWRISEGVEHSYCYGCSDV
jgi:hypothetical protein